MNLDRKHHTAGVPMFAGSKVLRTQACKALLDTGSPAPFIQEKVWLRMLACGAASEDGLTTVDQETWGGFHGASLVNSSHVRLNVQLGNTGTVGRSSTVCLAVHARIVPDTAMSTRVLLGRDSVSQFTVRKFRDVRETERVTAFIANESARTDDQRFPSG